MEENDSDDEASIDSIDSLQHYTEMMDMLRADEWNEDKDLNINFATLPHIVRNVDEFCRLLRYKVISYAYVSIASWSWNQFHPDLFYQVMTKLSEALGTLQGLEILQLVELYCITPLPMMIIKQTNQVPILLITRGDPEVEVDSNIELMADALCDHPSLEVIEVKNLDSLEAGIIAAVLPTLPKLRVVCVGCKRKGRAQTIGPEAISHILRIATLREANFSFCTILETGIHAIAECLAESLLTKLTFHGCALPAEKSTADLLVVAVKSNFVLEKFDGAGIELKPEELTRLEDSDGAGQRLGTDSYHAFANPNQRSLLEAFPRLNKAGRRYLKVDPTCISEGVEVLRKVMEEESYTDLQVLDCLFLHLQENPLLCRAQED